MDYDGRLRCGMLRDGVISADDVVKLIKHQDYKDV